MTSAQAGKYPVKLILSDDVAPTENVYHLTMELVFTIKPPVVEVPVEEEVVIDIPVTDEPLEAAALEGLMAGGMEEPEPIPELSADEIAKMDDGEAGSVTPSRAPG